MEADVVTSRGTCLYCYGVFRPPPAGGENLWEGLTGVEGDSEVFAIGCRELAAAATTVPRSVYSQESLDRQSRDLGWISVRAGRHEQVIRRLIETRDVVPLKFATLYSTAERLREMLGREYEALGRRLDRVAGRQEWGIKAYGDTARMGMAFAQNAAAVQALEAEIAAAAAGQAYLLNKKKQRLLADGGRQLAAQIGEAIYSSLSRTAVESRRTRFFHSGSSPGDLPVLSAAVLVDRGRISSLEREAERLEAEYAASGIRIQLSGPWAPYYFCEEP